MRIGIQTWGSDGDIFPYFALANGLRNAGHTVTIVYTSADNKDYSAYAGALNISATRVHGDFEFEISNFPKEIFNARNPFKALKFVYEKCFDPAIPDMYKVAEQICLENDIVIGHNDCISFDNSFRKIRHTKGYGRIMSQPVIFSPYLSDRY